MVPTMHEEQMAWSVAVAAQGVITIPKDALPEGSRFAEYVMWVNQRVTRSGTPIVVHLELECRLIAGDSMVDRMRRFPLMRGLTVLGISREDLKALPLARRGATLIRKDGGGYVIDITDLVRNAREMQRQRQMASVEQPRISGEVTAVPKRGFLSRVLLRRWERT